MAIPTSPLIKLSPLAWEYSQNSALEAYRNHNIILPKPEPVNLRYGVAINLLKTVGYAFASIPEFCGLSRGVTNRTHMKIYWELTVLCWKALSNLDGTMRSLNLLKVYAHLNAMMGWDGPAIDLDATQSMVKEPLTLKTDEEQAADSLTFMNVLLTDEQYSVFINYIKKRLAAQPIETYDLRSLKTFALFLDMCHEHSLRCLRVKRNDFIELLPDCLKQLKTKGYMLAGYWWMGTELMKRVIYPYSPALDRLFFLDEKERRFLIENKLNCGMFELLTDTIMTNEPSHWDTVQNYSWHSPTSLLKLVQLKDEPKVMAYLTATCKHWKAMPPEKWPSDVNLPDLNKLALECGLTTHS